MARSANNAAPRGRTSSSDYLDRLIEGIEDSRIAGATPFQTVIGPEEKVLTVRCFPIVQWQKFQRLFALFVTQFYAMLSEYDWPEWEDYETDKKLARLSLMMQRMATREDCRRMVMYAIKRTLFRDPVNEPIPWWRRDRRKAAIKRGWEPPKPQGMSFRYFRKHVTVDQLMRIWMAVYLYNIAAVKKNARSLAALLKVELERSSSSHSETSGSPSTKPWAPRFPNSPFLRRDSENGKVIAIEKYMMRPDGTRIEGGTEVIGGGDADG
jgi:hypothetical protein